MQVEIPKRSRPQRSVVSSAAPLAVLGSLLFGCLDFLAQGEEGTAVMMLVLGAGICVVLALRPPRALGVGMSLAIAVIAWVSALGWIDALPQVDTAAHFAFALLATLVLAAPLGSDTRPRPGAVVSVGVVAGCVAVALGVLWELYEWASDLVLDTDMSLGWRDTLTDLGAVAAGAAVASAGLMRWPLGPTIRRGPAARAAGRRRCP